MGNTILIAVLVAVPAVCVVTLFVMATRPGRRCVQHEIERMGGQVVSIRLYSPSLLQLALRQTRISAWKVRYVAKTGEKRVAMCLVTGFKCSVKQDEPDASART